MGRITHRADLMHHSYTSNLGAAITSNYRLSADGTGGVVWTSDPTLQARQIMWAYMGNLAVDTELLPIYLHRGTNIAIKNVDLSVGTAPTTQAIIVDIETATTRGGSYTTIFSTRPQINAGSQESTAGILSDSTIAAGDFVRAAIDQIGSGTVGADLSIVLYGTQPLET